MSLMDEFNRFKTENDKAILERAEQTECPGDAEDGWPCRKCGRWEVDWNRFPCRTR